MNPPPAASRQLAELVPLPALKPAADVPGLWTHISGIRSSEAQHAPPSTLTLLHMGMGCRTAFAPYANLLEEFAARPDLRLAVDIPVLRGADDPEGAVWSSSAAAAERNIQSTRY